MALMEAMQLEMTEEQVALGGVIFQEQSKVLKSNEVAQEKMAVAVAGQKVPQVELLEVLLEKAVLLQLLF